MTFASPSLADELARPVALKPEPAAQSAAAPAAGKPSVEQGPRPCRPAPAERPAPESFRLLGADGTVSNDVRKTGVNNNDLIIGPTGSGKTRSYIKPNLLQNALMTAAGAPESMIVTDTKGNLLREVGPVLVAKGYEVRFIDFTNLGAEPELGYNPLDAVRFDLATRTHCEQDIIRIAKTLCPASYSHDPFWDNAAATLVTAMISYVLSSLPAWDRHLGTVYRYVANISQKSVVSELESASALHPESLFALKYQAFRSYSDAEKMSASVAGVAMEHLAPLVFQSALGLYKTRRRIDFPQLAQQPCALFLTVSDTDRSLDKLVNLLYAQALGALCHHADTECADSHLAVPVRLYLDDFAASAVIPDFDNITSVIRSRGISVSIVLQSTTQLEAMYGPARARTIINNCGHILYLGGHDTDTVHYMAQLSNCLPDRILNLPVDAAFLYEDGTGGRVTRRYRLEDHPLYGELPEAAPPADLALQ